mgnify:CR=1 FL=1
MLMTYRLHFSPLALYTEVEYYLYYECVCFSYGSYTSAVSHTSYSNLYKWQIMKTIWLIHITVVLNRCLCTLSSNTIYAGTSFENYAAWTKSYRRTSFPQCRITIFQVCQKNNSIHVTAYTNLVKRKKKSYKYFTESGARKIHSHRRWGKKKHIIMDNFYVERGKREWREGRKKHQSMKGITAFLQISTPVTGTTTFSLAKFYFYEYAKQIE